MNKELQQQLRDAGYTEDFNLSELIEACNGKFANLKDSSKVVLGGEFWWAEGGGEPKKCDYCGHIKDANHTMVQGKTPEEAVANLWLALNKK